MEISKEKILVLGGSSFMGLSLLQQLSQMTDIYDIYYINRGKKYWNYAVQNIKGLNYINGDRKDKVEFAKLLNYVSQKLQISPQNKWKAVIDFCAFKGCEVKSVYTGLQNLINLYIFISSDSLYDVCVLPEKYDYITENMSVRPKSLEEQEKLKEDESYGHHKLCCEEFLYEEINKDIFPFIILRLPDVFGPYDDTGRFWAYLIWIVEYKQLYPIQVDQRAQNRKFSFVYSLDVVQQIINLLKQPLNASQINQSYHICSDETLTTEEILENMLKALNIQYQLQQVKKSIKFYPSVDCGNITNQKAKQLLNFKPTPKEEVLKATINFFIQANQNNTDDNSFDEYDYAKKKLKKKFKDM